MITSINFGMFTERVKRFLANNWPNTTLDVTSNEILLYMFEAVGSAIVNSSKENFREVGLNLVSEGFITNYSFDTSTLSYDINTGDYYVTLPAPPVNLPLGYSISAPYFSGAQAKSYPLLAIQPFNRGYALKMPTPNYGVYYWVEGSILKIDSQGADLKNSGLTLNVPMQSPRSSTGSDDDVINIPDDQMSNVFDMVVAKLVDRMNRPKDNVNDGSPHYTEQP